MPRSSPFLAAVRALSTSQGGRRSYVNLFRTEVDAMPSVEDPPPGLVGVQFVLDDVAGSQRLHVVATFRHLELSFWWGVNALEMSRLLALAANEASFDRPPELGSITFYAAVAGWEKDPGLVARSELDSMDLEALTRLVADALQVQQGGCERLGAILRQKSNYTNAANIETAGLDALCSTVRALVAAGLAGRQQKHWTSVSERLDKALAALDAAIVDSENRNGHVREAVASLSKASELLG
jgi:hypothetical protein